MNKFYFYILIFIICSTTISIQNLVSKNSIRTNFEILDSLSKTISEKIIENVIKHNISKLTLLITNHSSSWLLEQNIVAVGNEKSLQFYNHKSDSINSSLNLNIIKSGIGYLNLDKSRDSIIRVIHYEINGTISRSISNELIPINNISSVYQDTLSRDDVNLIEHNSYDFSKSSVPEPPKSFFDEITEPLIIVSSAIIVIVLLFSVRSQ